MDESKSVFVLMPFDDEHEAVYVQYIKPICEEYDFEVNKANTMSTQQNIIRDIITGIRDADLLIADLTGGNANVHYEVGVADALGLPTILITQNRESAEFDLQSYNIIEYSTEIAEISDFGEDLHGIMDEIQKGEVDFGNPVTDFTDVTITPPIAVHTKEADTGDDENGGSNKELEEAQKGIIDYSVEAQRKQSNFMDNISDIINMTEELAENIEEHGNQIETVANSEENISPTRANRLARKAASEMERYGDELSEKIDPVKEGIESMMDAEDSFIEFANPDVDEQEEALKERKTDLRRFRDEAEDAIEGLESFYYEANELKGVSRELNRGIQKLSTPLSDLISTLTDGQAEAERMVQRIEQKLSE